MRITRLALTAISLCAASFGAVHAQDAIRPGLWEVNIIQSKVDGKDMVAQINAAQEQMRQAMAKMPPEQRKRMESMLSGVGGLGGGQPQRMCITPEMASSDKSMVPRPKNAKCDDPKVSKRGGRTAFEVMCRHDNGDQMFAKGETHMAGGNVRSKVESVMTKANGTKNTSLTETEMKFVSSDCGSVKPVDQIVKELTAPIDGSGKK